MNSSHNKALAFTKASACGNDFLIVEGGEDFGDLNFGDLSEDLAVLSMSIAITESAQTAWNGRSSGMSGDGCAGLRLDQC